MIYIHFSMHYGSTDIPKIKCICHFIQFLMTISFYLFILLFYQLCISFLKFVVLSSLSILIPAFAQMCADATSYLPSWELVNVYHQTHTAIALRRKITLTENYLSANPDVTVSVCRELK